MKNSRERKDGKDERKKSIANHVSGLYGSRKPARYLLGGVLKAQAASIGKKLEGTTETASGNDALTPSEGQNTGETEEGKLTVPQNLRVEDGYIVWDEVENAYGYRLRTTINGTEVSQVCYETQVGIDRFFHDNGFLISAFGDYDFKVCAFDGSDTSTEYSAPVAVLYEASLAAPANVKFNESDERIQWDEIDNAVRYNIRVFKDDANRTLYARMSIPDNSTRLRDHFSTSGNYWISVQAMDMDYHVSEWTEPIAASRTEREKPEAPKNLRLDDSGSLRWDAVEGVDDYAVCIPIGGTVSYYHTNKTQYDNWKTLLCPFSEATIQLYVSAHSNNGEISYSDIITPPFKPQRNESIPVPENLWVKDGYLRWDEVDYSCYWLRIWANETLLESSNRRTSDRYYIGNSMPTGSYEVELFIVDENGNYNSKRYPFMLVTVPDESVWKPTIFYKFETLLWDYDRLGHNQTRNFWIRLRKDANVVGLEKSTSEYFYGLADLSDGEYIVDVCVYESGDKIGNWSGPIHITKHDNGFFDPKNEKEFPLEVPDVLVEDRIRSITINPAFNMKNKDKNNNVELDLSKISLKAEEIYDEDGLKRAEEALGKPISGNKHYNLLDLTLLYDGKDFSNGYEGLVQVIIPLPAGHRKKTFSCYRLTEVDGVMTKQLIPGEQTEDSYIIYLEHFSEYLLYGESDEESHTHVYGESWEFDENSHWKECDCKVTLEEAAHAFGDWKTTKEATEDDDGMKERSCQVCSFKQTEKVPKLSFKGDDDKLTVPQNLRVEGDYIVWDEVKDAYGYRLRTTINGEEVLKDYYYDPGAECKVEIGRFFHEEQYPKFQPNYSGCMYGSSIPAIIDFGDYDFEVCVLDESKTPAEYSTPVSVSYKASFESPANVRLNESGDSIQWDVVKGARCYHIRVFKDDAARTLVGMGYGTDTSQRLELLLRTSGNYWISVQAMDDNYHVSEWTEPMAVSYTYTKKEQLDAPENLRLDDSGENLLWDAVEGADYYRVYLTIGGYDSIFSTKKTQYNNWKTLVCPYYKGTIEIQVTAHSDNGALMSPKSNFITPLFKQQRDESIPVPENLRFADGYLQWDTVDCSCYWLRIRANEISLESSTRSISGNSYYIGNRMPTGNYEVELFIVDENSNYNSKIYSVELNPVPDETVWIPKIYYKFETLLWDYDHLRHDKTQNFWIRLRKEKGDDVVRLQRSYSEKFYGLPDLSNGEYTVDVCVYESDDKLGNWSTPLHISKHDNGLFDKENESITDVEFPPEAVDVPMEDRITSITINPAFNMKNKTDQNVELDLSEIKVKAKEIYDEEGLKRAEEALGKPISGNKHYNLLDLTLLYKGEDFSNGYEGLVQVIIPLPAGHRDKTFSCYRLTEVDGVMTKELIPGEQTEDSYIIYLEHFSEYLLYGEGDEEIHTHAYGESWEFDENSHWKECACKATSEEASHTFGDWNITKEATENADGMKERSCQVCGFKQTEMVPSLSHIHAYGESWKSDGNSHWKECACKATSEVAAHAFGDWNITKEATADAEGMKERSCSVCGFKQTEKMPKLSLQDDEEEDDAEDDTEPAGTKIEQLGVRSPKTDGDTLFERCMALVMIIGFACLSLYFMLNVKWVKEP